MSKKKPTPIRDVVPERINGEMKRMGISRAKLASKSNISPSLICQVIKLKKPLTRDAAEAMCRVFSSNEDTVRSEYLMGLDDYRSEEDFFDHQNKMRISPKYGFVSMITEEMAFNTFMDYLGVKRFLQYNTDMGEMMHRYSYGSKEYTISASQLKTLIRMTEQFIKEQVLLSCEMLQPGNKELISSFDRAYKENTYIVERTPTFDEIMADYNQIASDPSTTHISFPEVENGEHN